MLAYSIQMWSHFDVLLKSDLNVQQTGLPERMAYSKKSSSFAAALSVNIVSTIQL
jgi:hypothetical protein